jgi:DNA-binding GntR family transcriptional regulator
MGRNETALPVASIDQSGLSQQIYESLKTAILSGNFAQGERLPTDDLARHFHVSAMPVRDALKWLEADGLVEIAPRRGVFVTKVTKETVKEIFHIRRIIEQAAVEHLADITSEFIEQLWHTYEQMFTQVNTFQDEDTAAHHYADYIELDAQFHSLIVSIPGNIRLSQLYQGLRWPMQLVLVFNRAQYERTKRTAIEHETIIQAIVTKDTAYAQKVIFQHLINAEEDLMRRLSEGAPL